ncbi:MAG: peroxide stress protein YaaA [Rhodobacteraceae bacterium]|nr:peroxide stress protein YaaA [Paracoccaceae bacterium]
MITVISPAKKLDFEGTPLKIDATEPFFKPESYTLSQVAKRLSVAELRQLMKISEPLAKLNQARFQAFAQNPTPEQTKPAALAFNGDTYTGLQADTLTASDLAFAQDHLRILSGLYGLLRPMDNIQPYRLEMGSKLATRGATNLYGFWGSRLSEALNETGEKWLLNCASNEYFSAIQQESLTPQILTPVFLEERDGTAKVVSFYAKKARGMMARFAIQNRIDTPEAIKGFDLAGYGFRADLSDERRYVFIRSYPDTAI